MKKTAFIPALSAVAFLAPAVLLAAEQQTLSTVIIKIVGYLNQILFLLIGVAVVMFVYYIIKYFIKADSERKEAGPYALYSILGFFIILSLWGIVNILGNTFGLSNKDHQPAQWGSFESLFPKPRGSAPSGSGGL